MTDEQVETEPISVPAIMRHPQFARGLDDIRNGRPFDADMDDDFWAYDRGRLFGAIAPKSMPLKDREGSINMQAVRLYIAASKRRWII